MNKGICSLSNIPLRKEDNSRSEIVSTLLFGEMFTIESNEGGEWTRIKTTFDAYEGWVSSKQITMLTTEPISFTPVSDFPFAIIQAIPGFIMAPYGSLLPDYDGTNCYINGVAMEVTNKQTTQTAKDIRYISRQFVNAPYLWGGKMPFGIDCSGFTQVIFRSIGIALKRDAYLQAEQGTTIAFLEETQTGDLAFFDNEEGQITHVGIMLDPHSIIHASGRVRIDNIDSYGILNAENRNYSHKLRIIKRVLS
ncbi:MAG: SH3 domain-containing C40 family peptidase [Bacteroidota bacterium]